MPTRKTGSSLIQKNTSITPLHEEAYTTHLTNLSRLGQTPKTTITTGMTPVKRNPKHSKLTKIRRPKNTQLTKQQGQNAPDLTNEEEIGSLPEKEFRIMIGKTIQHRGNRREKIQETFHRGRQELKSKQTVMKNTINENNYSLAWITSTITEAEERLSGLEDKIVQINTADQNKEQRKKGTEDRLSDPWDNIKCTNIRIIWVSEEEEK